MPDTILRLAGQYQIVEFIEDAYRENVLEELIEHIQKCVQHYDTHTDDNETNTRCCSADGSS